MSNLLLIDSSYYIRLLVQREDPLDQLDERAEEDGWDLAVCGIVWAEVLRGRSDRALRNRFHEAFSQMCFLNLTPQDWQRAAQLAWQLDRQGAVLPATDLAIAQCALSAGAAVLTFDQHFERIPGLHLLQF